MLNTRFRFKRLASGYSNFYFPKSLLVEVDLTTFCKPETNRFPLFIGTQSGMSPRFNFALLEGQKIAVLHRSQYSGYQNEISIYRIINGERIKVNDIALEAPFWNKGDLVEFKDELEEPIIHPLNRFPEGYRLILNIYLGSLPINGSARSLSDVYNLILRNSYPPFLEYAFKNKGANWDDFLNSGFYSEIFVFLNKCTNVVSRDEDNRPLELKNVLSLIRNIKNPYHVRNRKYFEIPETPDVLLLSDFGLNIYYNNYININAVEALKIQKEIIEELKVREYYVVNPYQLIAHANPIVIMDDGCGGKQVAVNKKLPFRNAKDVVNLKDRANGLLKYEGAYGGYNSCTDMELVKAVNDEIKPTIWNGAISLKFKALLSQFERRNIDFSSLKNEEGYVLDHCVILEEKTIIRLGNLPEEKILVFLTSYFKECYPGMGENGLSIIFYNDHKLRFYLNKEELCYEMKTNDLIQRKNAFTYLPGIKINKYKS